MIYTDPVYRPPFEARSLLLQVTRGCSHNRCSFCTMYRNVPFAVESFVNIEESLAEAREYVPNITRVFLENGDPFVLEAERLLVIAERIHKYLPKVETIAMYASVKNIMNKTDAQLKALRQAGINELNVGVESGLDRTLSLMQKGYTADQALRELTRLREADMDYGANIILGAAGSGHWEENAAATAALLNQTTPYLIFTGTIHADPGCPLYGDIKNGQFAENTIEEYLNEEDRLLELLQLDPCYYFGLHPSNIVPMHGFLPKDRERMREEIADFRQRHQAILVERPVRGNEGAVLW